MKTPIKIDLVADLICPWCYLGKTRLEQAMANKRDQYEFSYTLLPFQLYPKLPEEGSPLSDFKHKRRPGAGRAILAEAKETGITIDYKKIDRMPNSYQALKLMYLASGSEKQAPFVQKLYKAYFEEGIDIGKRDVLMDFALELRMDSKVLRRFDDPNWDATAFQSIMDKFRSEGVTNVPTIIFNDQFPVIGVQPIQNLYRYFKRLENAS
ncbi:MAG: DsbA family oxidoreductase [Bacteroidota bacterium]